MIVNMNYLVKFVEDNEWKILKEANVKQLKRIKLKPGGRAQGKKSKNARFEEIVIEMIGSSSECSKHNKNIQRERISKIADPDAQVAKNKKKDLKEYHVCKKRLRRRHRHYCGCSLHTSFTYF